MHQFVRNLLTEWRRLELPFAGGAIVVAASGGTDSNSLLLAIKDLTDRKKLGHRIVAAHFNHGLRGHASDSDEEYVRQLTVKLGVEFAVGYAKAHGDGNLEQNARHARYQFLAETAANVEAFAVLTAHTINDQAETFLINLLRGAGPQGLSGMRPVRGLSRREDISEDWEKGSEGERELGASPLLPFSSTRVLLVRPLLRWAKRQQTEGFCRDLNVECCHDAMNDDTAFKRVRIRKILLPLLQDFNPKIVETLAQTAHLMAESLPSADRDRRALDDQLTVSELKELIPERLNSVIREWLKAQRGTTRELQLKHIDAVGRLALSEKSGKTAELPGGGRVIKANGRLRYEQNQVEN